VIRLGPAQRGFSYLEVLVAVVVVAVALTPALEAIRTGFESADVHARSVQLAARAAGTLETVLAEPFATLRAEAAAAGAYKVPTSYSDSAGAADRAIVYLSYYDAGDSDGDGNPFTILDPDTDGDSNPYTGGTPHIGLLWARVEIEGTAVAFESLTAE
jgi:prepilin-type N-terminal cleavage/methylation domain-containing protein